MEFFLTKYIYPLSEPIALSNHLGFCLDNPREREEIEIVRDYLVRAYESDYDYKFPISSTDDIFTLEYAIDNFRNQVDPTDSYIHKIFESYSKDNIFEFLAQIWIIIRFDDGGLGAELREEHEKERQAGKRTVFLLDDDHPIIRGEEKLGSYCHLLSLLIHCENSEYMGRQFLVESQRIDVTQPTKKIWRDFLFFGMCLGNFREEDSLNWLYFPYVRNKIIQVSQTIEQAFDKGLEEKLLYIGNILKITSQNFGDEKTQVILLTSIVELLLTHNPDFNRFNVEDSISKQFQLKASILVYMNDRTRDISAIQRRLKVIYSQRSNIAHGNFKVLNKYINGLSKKEGKEEYFDQLVTDLYFYVRIIIEEYLNDYSFVEFLKKS